VQQVAEPRLETIEGQKTLVVERTPPLQPKLIGLLGALFHVRIAKDIRPAGARASCEADREHRFETLREGRHVGLDGIVRDLRIQMCLDCGAACVRDISYDSLPGLPTGGQHLRRRDLVLGWYTGARRSGREYR
jgi:hypothetical protein